MPRTSFALLVCSALIALSTEASGQSPSFAGVWVLDSSALVYDSRPPRRTTRPARRPDSAAARDSANGALAPEPESYRSVFTIIQLDTAIVIDRRIVDSRRRPIPGAPPERLSWRLDNRNRAVPWTTPSGGQGTAIVRARPVPDSAAVVLFTRRWAGPDSTRARITQLRERLELQADGRLKVTRTEWEGARERRRVLWFSRG